MKSYADGNLEIVHVVSVGKAEAINGRHDGERYLHINFIASDEKEYSIGIRPSQVEQFLEHLCAVAAELET